MGGTLNWERRRGAGVNKRVLTMNGYRWVGSRKDEETNNPENDR